MGHSAAYFWRYGASGDALFAVIAHWEMGGTEGRKEALVEYHRLRTNVEVTSRQKHYLTQSAFCIAQWIP